MGRTLRSILLLIIVSSCSTEPYAISIIEHAQSERIYLYDSAGESPKLIIKNTDALFINAVDEYTEGAVTGKEIGEARVYSADDSVVLAIYKTETDYSFSFTEGGKEYYALINDQLAETLDTTYYPALKNFRWLLGAWSVLGDSSLVEVWKRDGASKFSGTGYKLKCNADTTLRVIEKLQLKYGANGIEYLAGVSDQNDGKDIHFASVWDKDTTSVRFEAPEHDFPQVIEYTLFHPDTLGVSVGLLSEGGFSYNMRMHKIKPKKHSECLSELFK